MCFDPPTRQVRQSQQTPSRDSTRLDAEAEQRRVAQRARGTRKNLMSDVADEDFANVGRKRKLGSEAQ